MAPVIGDAHDQKNCRFQITLTNQEKPNRTDKGYKTCDSQARNIKRCLSTLVIKEIQNKPQMRFCFIPIELVKLRNVSKAELLYIAFDSLTGTVI